KTGVGGKGDPAIIPLVTKMVTGATGKPEFDDCPIAIADLGALVAGGTAALNAESLARDTLALRVTQRKDQFVDIREGVAQFADFARSFYKGDKAKLQAVGLDVVEPLGLGLLPAPKNLRSKPGLLEGTIALTWTLVIGRDFYTVECAQSASGPWTEVYKGKAGRTSCTGLTSGAEYFFRTRAWNASGPGAWSDITKKRAS
ncbi:MAG TPA: fibronectin type III domain-containing protein, partial [Verrucomicrobiae bacterium]